MTAVAERPAPAGPTAAAPPPWSDVADAIWRRSRAEQHAAMRGDESTHDEPEEA